MDAREFKQRFLPHYRLLYRVAYHLTGNEQEAERALNLLAYNLNKGMEHLEKAKALSDKTEKSLNKQLKVLKRYETDNH